MKKIIKVRCKIPLEMNILYNLKSKNPLDFNFTFKQHKITAFMKGNWQKIETPQMKKLANYIFYSKKIIIEINLNNNLNKVNDRILNKWFKIFLQSYNKIIKYLQCFGYVNSLELIKEVKDSQSYYLNQWNLSLKRENYRRFVKYKFDLDIFSSYKFFYFLNKNPTPYAFTKNVLLASKFLKENAKILPEDELNA